MPEDQKIIGVDRVGLDVLVTFNDGRVTTLNQDEIYGLSEPPPPDPDKE